MSLELISVGSAMFSLGVLHALDPAHGKVFLGGYFAKVLNNPKKLIFASLLVALVQTLVLLAAGTLIAFFSIQWVTHEHFEQFMDTLSGISLMVLGGIMLWHQREHLMNKPDCCDGHHHSPEEAQSIKKVLPLVIWWGLIPCPIALTALLTGFSLGNMALTIGSLLVFTLGVASILVSSGLCFLYGSHFVSHRLQQFAGIIPYIGFGFGILVLALGGLLTYGGLTDQHFLNF